MRMRGRTYPSHRIKTFRCIGTIHRCLSCSTLLGQRSISIDDINERPSNFDIKHPTNLNRPFDLQGCSNGWSARRHDGKIGRGCRAHGWFSSAVADKNDGRFATQRLQLFVQLFAWYLQVCELAMNVSGTQRMLAQEARLTDRISRR